MNGEKPIPEGVAPIGKNDENVTPSDFWATPGNPTEEWVEKNVGEEDDPLEGWEPPKDEGGETAEKISTDSVMKIQRESMGDEPIDPNALRKAIKKLGGEIKK